MADLDHRTGQQIIGEINKDALRELYVKEEIVEDYKILRSIIVNGSDKERIQAIKLLWEYTIEKPKQTSEVRFPDGLSKMTDSQLDEIINKFSNDKREISKTSQDQETTAIGS